MDPLTTAYFIYKGLGIADTFFAGKAYRNRLKTQRSLNQLKGLKEWNNTWNMIIDDLKENHAVFSSSGAIADPSSGSFEAIQKEVSKRGKDDLDTIELMTKSMTAEMNYRIDQSRKSDNFSILKDFAEMAYVSYDRSLNTQHKEIQKRAMDIEKQKILYPYKYKTVGGKVKLQFTSSRDLFENMNVGGNWTKLKLPKYKMEYHFGKNPIFTRQIKKGGVYW